MPDPSTKLCYRTLEASDQSTDGKVRTHINQIASASGRMSSSKPNLMGIPKAHEMRRCFIPSEGYLFIRADYSSLEPRILADRTQDPGLCKLFNDEGDPYVQTAVIMTGKQSGDITTEDRLRAKPVFLGFMYAMSPSSLPGYARHVFGVSISENDAIDCWTRLEERYPRVCEWQDEIWGQTDPALRTASRRLHVFNEDEYLGKKLNFPIQGTAADGFKEGLNELYEALSGYDARIVLPVHDEVLVEVRGDVTTEVKSIVIDALMSGMKTYVTTVPIEVDADIRSTWASADIIKEV